MKVALTKGTLWVPPTYFAVQHAVAMPDIDVRVFDLVSDIADPAVKLDVVDAVPGAGRVSRRAREIAKWAALGRMARQVREWEPDLIHQHQGTWSLPAVRAAREASVPLVTTLHGADAYVLPTLTRAAAADSPSPPPPPSRPFSPSGRLQAPTRRKGRPGHGVGQAWNERNVRVAIDASTVVLAVSQHLAQVALERGVPASKIHVHYQGVDTDWFSPVPSPPRSVEHPHDSVRTLVFVGALSELKGIRDLVAVSMGIYNTSPHRLVIVGDGPLRPFVERTATHAPHISAYGALDRVGVREHVRAADALVLPTRRVDGRAEAAGLVILEAQACQTPVVVNAVGGTSEMFVDSETGLATIDGDLDSLADALRRLIAMSDADLASMSTAARQWVVAHRSLSTSVGELRDIYSTLTAS